MRATCELDERCRSAYMKRTDDSEAKRTGAASAVGWLAASAGWRVNAMPRRSFGNGSTKHFIFTDQGSLTYKTLTRLDPEVIGQ